MVFYGSNFWEDLKRWWQNDFKGYGHLRSFLVHEGGLVCSLTARVIPISRFIFKGSLVDPRLRASNEHIPILSCALREQGE